ncbi:hypothetical protein PR202_ga23440 [Eleusine coracana subsp. coracana]|uniref:Uncharacterized protein n=1 Tax=Eleusine coracana subsp. coracana TaxID=191504 RepID=A0AAV5D5R2_ELECO|nr:hypothetical protein PR202_ga23440 [Eleusine coracana subsp. coracana]
MPDRKHTTKRPLPMAFLSCTICRVLSTAKTLPWVFPCVYRSGYYCYTNYMTDFTCGGIKCPSCKSTLTRQIHYYTRATGGAGGAKGFVKGIVTYIVLDNLTISPMSAASSITLLNTLAVRDIADLQEKTVSLGYNEGLAILKASLQSRTVLTDVFLGTKNASGRS